MNTVNTKPWVIADASGWINGKPSIEKIIEENNYESVIMVAKKDGKDIFIIGAGNRTYGENGDHYLCKTGNREGILEIENAIVINDKEVLSAGNSIGLNEKRKLYVFK